jgi:hypothetical protein
MLCRVEGLDLPPPALTLNTGNGPWSQATHDHITERYDQLNRRFMLAWSGGTAAAVTAPALVPTTAGASPDAEANTLWEHWLANAA